MSKKRKKLMGPVVYFVHMEATSSHADKPPLTHQWGPFASMKEAEMKRMEEEEAVGTPGYEYEYRIESASTAILRAELKDKGKR